MYMWCIGVLAYVKMCPSYLQRHMQVSEILYLIQPVRTCQFSPHSIMKLEDKQRGVIKEGQLGE